jgi:hypothetical protein
LQAVCNFRRGRLLFLMVEFLMCSLPAARLHWWTDGLLVAGVLCCRIVGRVGSRLLDTSAVAGSYSLTIKQRTIHSSIVSSSE